MFTPKFLEYSTRFTMLFTKIIAIQGLIKKFMKGLLWLKNKMGKTERNIFYIHIAYFIVCLICFESAVDIYVYIVNR